jgi:two-component system, cell cycle sensor histidine kinase and response regulator CckA
MKDPSKTKQELIEELSVLKQRIQELEKSVSKRKQMGEALRESEEKYRKAFHTNQDSININRLEDGMYISINEGFTKLTGYTEADIAGRTSLEINIWENLADRNRLVEGLRRDGKVENLEAHFRKNDGVIIHGLMSASVINLDGVPHFLNVTRDITDRKRVEEALRESEKKYRLIAENTADLISILDMNLRFTYVSPASMRHRGFTVEEAMEQTIEQVLTPKSMQLGLTVFEKEMQLEASGTADPDRMRILELEEYKKDGSIIWAEVSLSFLRDKDRKPVEILTVSRDITERKQAEEALRKSEERYRLLVENANEAILVIQDGMITFVNSRAVTAFGYSEQEFLSIPIFELIHPEDRDVVTERYRQKINGDKTSTRHTYRTIHKSGQIQWIEISSVLIDWEGRPATLNLITDITERKQAEEGKRVLEERLQHANKMEAIGTLAGGIAHDFNNLLMGIQGYTSLTLLNLDPDDQNRERLKKIEEHVQSGADLANQLLGFARGGRYEIKPTDINDVIQKTSSMFGRTKKEISIHRKHGQDLWGVEVDRGQMEQVFMNLYVNSWQAMPGGGEIYLETENVLLSDEQAMSYSLKPGRHVKISVTDTGTGMDGKIKERIFDPFFTTKTMGRGTGLGLATVYGIIKGHKGMINVYSEPGHGTIFTIHLPASEKEVVKEEVETETIDRGTETILLVEDEKMVLEVNRELLESMGYRVFAVGSGQEAIALYMGKRNEIDLVILDMIMPGISGGETFDRLREINPLIKVLLSSGYSLKGEAQTIMDRGCKGFLQKPFQIERLSQKVREILD